LTPPEIDSLQEAHDEWNHTAWIREERGPCVRVYKGLSGVTWTHRKHLDAGMKCQMCHGEVAQMDRMSEVMSVTTMGVCLNCHKEYGAPAVCQTSHPWPPAD
jgi:hypothetical protein